jgi:glycosyltransferase involved in cell wall biosynthesis
LKTALYRTDALDAWLDERVGPATRLAGTVAGRAYLRLLPERALRRSPFTDDTVAPRSTVLLLTLVPPEDTGGGSRPARLAAELVRRGFAIDWRYALPIFPWPRRHRPALAAVSVRSLLERGGTAALPAAPIFTLVEAPHPRFSELLDRLPPERPVIYDAIDLWDGSLGAGWYDPAVEDAMLDRAGALIASSRLLCEETARRTGRAVTLVANGVDPRLFDPSIPRPTPSDLRRGAPTVVYVGSLWGEWVDLDLVERVARALPAARFNLIGPAGSRRLPAAPNLAILGMRAQSDLPAYLASADVAIVPFATGRLTAAVSPLKAFEYLAMAVPVVATPLPELDGVPGVTTAHDASSFAAAVVAAASAPFPRAAAAAFVARHTWQDRVERLLEIAGVAVGDVRVSAQRKD